MREGIKTLISSHSVDETVQRLEVILKQKGIKLFCVVDHSGEALAAGLAMPPTRLLIFGNPKAGTPLMLAAPSAALDLPLKILVAEQPDGKALLSWNDAAWLQVRHGFPAEMQSVIAAVEMLAQKGSE
ncbi:MAG TPA: DUF302 domain-containing protein [Acidobacteriaceae bacterium]|nr:DUF302 domain-containing protein [Acidobacteriaceae bacterium]